jgi:hypothetical protein
LGAVGQPCYPNTEVNSSNYETESTRQHTVGITVVVTLSGLIIFGTLATVIQIDNEMLAFESIAELGNPPQPEHYSPSVFFARRNREK